MLFGGFGAFFLNDLWKYDGVNWTWIGGTNFVNQPGIYGTKGVPDPNNIPGARYASISWIDESNSFWLFGGSGIDSNQDLGYLNDLWKFDWLCEESPLADINIDCRVNFVDWAMMVSHWLEEIALTAE